MRIPKNIPKNSPKLDFRSQLGLPKPAKIGKNRRKNDVKKRLEKKKQKSANMNPT